MVICVLSVSTLVSTFVLSALPIEPDRSFLTEVLLPRQHLRRDPTPMQLPRQHPTIQAARSRLSHWLQRVLRNPTPMQLPQLHLPVVNVDADATTASNDPGRLLEVGLLALASSVRPDSDAATTTAPSGREDLDAAATTASDNPALTDTSDSRDLVKVVTPDRGLCVGSLGRWDCELFL